MTPNPFADVYIPTIEECEAIDEGKMTVDELHEQVRLRTQNPETTEDPVAIVEIPILRETPYFEKGSKDKLKAVCNPHEVLVSRDANTTGAKSYQIIGWEKWLKKTARYDTNDYECLRGAVYPYMDIESEKDDINVVDMLNHSIGVFIDALQKADIQVVGVALSNSSRPGKHSFHAVIHTDKVFENTLTLKEFIMTQVKPNFYTGVSDELRQSLSWSKLDKKTEKMMTMDCVDWAVYTTDRVMRFLGQSKLGKKVKLTPYTHDDIILPCPLLTAPADYLIGQYGQGPELPIFAIELPQHIQKTKEARESGKIEPTVQLEQTYLGELADLISDEIIQSGTTCCKFIWAMTRSGASADLVHNHCKRTGNYNKEWVDYHIQHAANMNVNIGTLRYWASQNNKPGFHTLSKKYMKQELANEVHSFQTVIPTEQYSERYVRPFSFDNVDTLLLKSHLGTGKTTQLVNAIKNKKQFLKKDLVPFKRILIVSGRKSFTKFITGDLDENKLGFKAYDEKHKCSLSSIDRLVIQVESLWRLEDGFNKYDLVAIDESETVAHQFYSDATHRHNMIKNHIMFERCLSTATKVWLADAFLGNRTVKIAEALRNIEHAKMIENTYCPYERKAIQLKSSKNGKDAPATTEFCNRIMADLKKGLKIAVIWGSKNKAKAFTDMFLKETNYNWKLYTSESSADDRNDLSNVEESWKTVDCLNYTSTITVGVNYDPAEESAHFDKLYLFASASGGLPRDIAQALLRCRKIKTNTLVYTVDKKSFGQTALYGCDTIREAIADKKQTILRQNPVATWENAPKWAEENYIENENENGAKCIAFNEILNGYLEKSGYTITSETVDEDESVKLQTAGVTYEEIPEVDGEALEKIKRRSKAGYASYEEKLILQKHRFRTQLTTTDTRVLGLLWVAYMSDKSGESIFWNLVGEKHQTTNEYLAYESTQKYIQQSSKKCLKRIALDKVLNIIGAKNSADSFSLEISDDMTEKLKAIKDEVYKAFQAHGTRSKGEFKASNAVDMVAMVYKGWNGAEIAIGSKKKQSKGVRKNVFTISKPQTPLWELITQRNTDEEVA